MVKHKLLIIEEQAILRLGLSTLLSLEPDFDVVAEYGSLQLALPKVAKLAPDLVITDFEIGFYDKPNPLAVLKELCATTRILILTDNTEDEAIRAALRAGASGYLLKDTDSTELVVAIRSLLAGKIYLSPSISGKVINAFLVTDKCATPEEQQLSQLTDREREILRRVAEGYTSRHIAMQLDLSVKTVEKHRANLMRKLNLHNASALTLFAIGHGLIDAEHRS